MAVVVAVAMAVGAVAMVAVVVVAAVAAAVVAVVAAAVAAADDEQIQNAERTTARAHSQELVLKQIVVTVAYII